MQTGFAQELGPVKLPMLTAGDAMGGAATLEMGVRRDLPGTPFEVLAIASARPAMETLAGYQKTALFMFAGLLAAAIALTLLLGGSAAAVDSAAYVGPRVPAPPVQVAAKTDATKPLPIADVPPAPEATADDFNFTAGPGVAAQSANSPGGGAPDAPAYEQAPAFASPPPVNESEDDPFASLGQSDPPPRAQPPPAAAPTPAMNLDEDDGAQRTTTYKAHGYKAPMPTATTQSNPVSDPFAMAGGMMSADEQMQEENPDATRVAAIPQELINASARGNTKENPMGAMPRAAPMPRVAAAIAPAVSGAGSEEAHFQDVFRDFVATRERCGEPADGLTFDKFVTKLRKNKEQLVVKYNCKTVRFQVYVKEGKAALKATPVKE